MTHDQDKPRPFPWRCPACRAKAVEPASVSYKAPFRHDGKERLVEVPSLRIPKCRQCGELVFDNEADEQVANAFRRDMGMMLPEEIRTQRESLRLTQRQLADALGVAIETISRWETGLVIQSRAMDRYLRTFFTIPEARTALTASAAK